MAHSSLELQGTGLPLLLQDEELHRVKEPKELLQAVRPIYKSASSDTSTTTTTSADVEIVHVAIHKDSEGKQIVLWEDISIAFKDAVNIRHGTKILPFLRGGDFKA